MPFGRVGVFAALLLLGSSGARADEQHYRNILIGDRAAGMAGAYTAVSDDPSGLYYNPAGTLYSAGGNLSASMNALHLTETTYDKALGGNDWKRSSVVFIPDFFGVLQPLGKGVVGFSYAVPESISEDQDQIFEKLPSSIPGATIDRYVINFNQEDSTYNVGPSYAWPLGGKVSVGATLYGHYRHRELILNQLVNLSTGQYEWSTRYLETSEYGVRPLLGVMYAPADKWSVGLSLTKTYVLSSKTSDQRTLKTITDDGNTVSFETETNHARRAYPLTTTLGVAWFPSEVLALAGDFSYYGATQDDFGDRKATWNAALGVEYYLNQRWAVRTGLFTNRANSPEVASGQLNQDPHVDYYGGSLSLTHFTRNSSVSLGANYSRGSGKDQVISGSTAIQNVAAQTLTVLMSASYRY
jgi:long-chain fatty acid transport protein